MSIKNSKNWLVLNKIPDNLINENRGLSLVVLQLLYNRNITEKSEIKNFLNHDYEQQIHDPFLLKDMDKASSLIIKHIKEGNKIIVYGDYDVDGVSSSALLYEALQTLKAKIDIYIPDRVKEGYGMNEEAIKSIAKDNFKLMITVDNGIRNKKEVGVVKKLGMDIIITDHHVESDEKEDIPETLTINPVMKKENYPFKFLAGVGVAFKLAQAIISKTKLDIDIQKRLEKRLLDLVAIGTIADCVVLHNENRALVKEGMRVLNNTKRKGIKELIEVSKINKKKKLDAWNIGFQIGPRLNASGRLGSAREAFDLLVEKDGDEARRIAKKLNSVNIERQKITEETMIDVETQIGSPEQEKILIGVCPEDKDWPDGVIGLAAGKISEKYYRPSLVITHSKDGYKGSGRSIKELNIIEAIEEFGDMMTKFGGHPAACGFSLPEENLDKFIRGIKKYAEDKLKDKELKPQISIDCEIDIKEIDSELCLQIESLAPFGQGNPAPKFLSKNVQIKDIMNMGLEGQHIKFRFNGLWGLAFSKAEEWGDFKVGEKVDIVYSVEKNEFNGRTETQLRIIDIKHS